MNELKNDLYLINGINIFPNDLVTGEFTRIDYDGLLARSGAEEVYLHYGFSTNDKWTEVTNQKMNKNANRSFSTEIKIKTGSFLQICFHDSAQNWDNNNGKNYIYPLKYS